MAPKSIAQHFHTLALQKQGLFVLIAGTSKDHSDLEHGLQRRFCFVAWNMSYTEYDFSECLGLGSGPIAGNDASHDIFVFGGGRMPNIRNRSGYHLKASTSRLIAASSLQRSFLVIGWKMIQIHQHASDGFSSKSIVSQRYLGNHTDQNYRHYLSCGAHFHDALLPDTFVSDRASVTQEIP
jgi:hypothetical protein|tara:strand:- start:7305 stop:7847 length:543 start_codon:yes stop_codon:yes gene_type:complete